jgi:hypothetical protein
MECVKRLRSDLTDSRNARRLSHLSAALATIVAEHLPGIFLAHLQQTEIYAPLL